MSLGAGAPANNVTDTTTVKGEDAESMAVFPAIPANTPRYDLFMADVCDWNLGNLPNYSPIGGANASVAFASFLAATVLAVSVQVVFQRARSGRSHNLSIAVAPLTFVVLVASAYEYVRLAGRTAGTSPTSEISNLSCDTITMFFEQPGDLVSQQHITAALFAVAGSLLAIGGVASVLILTLVLHEHSAERVVRQIATATFWIAAATTAVLLLDGMYEIYAVLAIEEVEGAVAVGATGSVPIAIVGTVGFVVGVIVYASARPVAERLSKSGNEMQAAIVGLVLLILVPVTWAVLLDSDTSFDLRSMWDIIYVTYWFSCFTAMVAIMAAVERRSSELSWPERPDHQTCDCPPDQR